MMKARFGVNAHFVILLGALSCWLCVPTVARGGMGAVTISETLTEVRRVVTFSNLATFRLDAISFFLGALLVCAWIIQLIWNSLVRDFPKLPRLSYFRALGMIGLWGLLFLLVLTMISGARELMTPGAWEKKGFTYQLVRDPPSQTSPTNPEAK